MSSVDKKDKKKRKVFGDDETLHLLQIWASDKIQKQFYSTTRHNLIYESIARQLKELGFISTCEEVKSKIRNLKTEYRSKKPKSGSSTPDWKYFSIIHKVLGQRDAANDDLMDESLADVEENFNDADLSSQQGNSEDVEVTEESPSHSIIQQSRSSLSPPVAKTANNSRIRKISRPPRRANSKEDKLIDTLLKTEEVFQHRLVRMENLERDNEQRDDLVAASMVRFLNAFAELAEKSVNQATSPVSLGIPLINEPEKHLRNNAVHPIPEKKKYSPLVPNNFEVPPVTALSSEQPWMKRSKKSSTMVPSAARSVRESTDTGQYVGQDISESHGTVEYVDAMDSPLAVASYLDEQEECESYLEYFDDTDYLLPSHQAQTAEEEETSTDPVYQFIQSEMNSKIPKISEKDRKPRIISYERVEQPYVNIKKSEHSESNISTKPTGTSPIHFSQRIKSGNILIHKKK